MVEKEKEALGNTIEEWTWLAETGGCKGDWPDWDSNGGSHKDDKLYGCFLCQYYLETFYPGEDNIRVTTEEGVCTHCIYAKKFCSCFKGGSYVQEWEDADYFSSTKAQITRQRKKYAKLILKQLKELESEQAAN